MEELQVSELKISYYEYIVKIPQGIQTIIVHLTNNELENAFISLANLADGLDFLLKVESYLFAHNFIINSRINDALGIYNEINSSLENCDYILLKDLLKYELYPVFESCAEWQFVGKGVD